MTGFEKACLLQLGAATQALELIATPVRSDGTYNRDRKACEILARETLDKIHAISDSFKDFK